MSKPLSGGDPWRRAVAALLALVVVVAVARTVELYIDGAWTDVTSGGYVLADDPITITDGADSQSVLSSPGSCALSLLDNDKDGRWSNRVPGSTYYRRLGRNTPIRVSVDGDVRCVMEVPEWSPRWELGDAKVRAEIEAAGILRRLTEGARSLPASIERSILAAAPVAYWPLTDGPDATQAGSGVSGVRAMELSGTVDFDAVTGLLGNGHHPQFLDANGDATGQLVGTVPLSDADAWTVEGWVRGTSDTTESKANAWSWTIAGGSSFARADINVVYDDGVGNSFVVIWFYSSSGSLAAFYTTPFGTQVIDDMWHHIAVRLVQTGASTWDFDWYIDGELIDSDSGAGDIGYPDKVYASGLPDFDVVNKLDSLSVAHLAVFANDSDPVDRYQAGIGYAGETAGRRIERLLSEHGVAFASVGDLDDTAAMGPQTTDTLVANLEACAVADQGRLYETRTALGLTYRTRVSLYNQYGPLLDYSVGHVAPPLEPSEDLTFAHNDVTVSRDSGSTARSTLDVAVDPYHTLTTQAPPDGIGTYDRGTIDANVATDDQLQHIADWIRHLGTWDELRYPQLTVEFANPVWQFQSELAAALAALETGDQLRLDGLPAWLPPDQYAAIVQGRTEVIGTHTRTITWNLQPGWPLEVWQMDSSGSTLAAAVASNGTSLKLATSAGSPWKTGSPLGTPYYIQAFGNAMQVTTLTTDTPAFIAAGAIAHGNNASVSPGLPAGMTPDVGQVLLGWAAIRNSGTGVPDLPTGYTNLALFGNVRFFGKYYVTGDAAPTVSFTGGVANADTSARLWGMSGVSLELDDGKYLRSAVSPQTLLNSSAQNIAWPVLTIRRDNCVAFILAWKQDDWTSVATPGSMDAEIMDNATTTGDDQGIAAYYDIQTSATDIAAGSLTVTGGAAAISRAVVLALRPLQTATVVRGINGVSTAIAAGEAVQGWRLGVLGL